MPFRHCNNKSDIYFMTIYLSTITFVNHMLNGSTGNGGIKQIW
jgi:hypothetical protein